MSRLPTLKHRMLRTAAWLAGVAAAGLAAADARAQEADPAPAPAAPQRPAFESLLYRFDAERDLADFEPLSGSWSLSAGSLWCTSKGAREELRWRRALTPRGRVTARLLGVGRVALLLRAGAQETQVVLDRGAGQVAIEADGAPLAQRSFESKPGRALALQVEWELDRLKVRVGDDESFTVVRSGSAGPFDGFALLSLQSQPRFEELTIEREPVAETAVRATGRAPLSEGQRLAVEQATRLLEADDPGRALELLRESLGSKPPDAAEWPAPLLTLLQRVGLRRAALLTREPLATLVAAAKLSAADGSATVTLPLQPGFSGEAAPFRRTDGLVFTLRCADPPLAIEIYRYDQKLKYWFGRDPRLVYSSGGGGATLGRARADEQQDLHPRAERVRAFERSDHEVDGEHAWEYELAWPDPDDASRTLGLRELFVLHRGDTWRLTIAGSPLAQQTAAEDLTWLIERLRFER